MARLTRKDKNGNWHLKGVSWERLRAGAELDKATADRIYGALCKLMAYEDTGLDPAEVVDVNEFEKAQTVKLLKKLADEREKHLWIPVENPPKAGKRVLCYFGYEPDSTDVICENKYIGSGIWQSEGDGVLAWRPLPEPYSPERSEE